MTPYHKIVMVLREIMSVHALDSSRTDYTGKWISRQ
jgi:hypothetical protein